VHKEGARRARVYIILEMGAGGQLKIYTPLKHCPTLSCLSR